jgi:hypothetical protein
MRLQVFMPYHTLRALPPIDVTKEVLIFTTPWSDIMKKGGQEH